jgi:hypothetical protein
MTRQRDCEFRQAIFCRRRHQPRRPPLAKIRPGRRCDLFTLVNNHLSNVFDLNIRVEPSMGCSAMQPEDESQKRKKRLAEAEL